MVGSGLGSGSDLYAKKFWIRRIRVRIHNSAPFPQRYKNTWIVERRMTRTVYTLHAPPLRISA